MENPTFRSTPTQQPARTALSRGPGAAFPELAARYLDEYMEKISRAVTLLDEEQIWWRPCAKTNSIGNLLLHLSGNLTLWLVQGLGGDTFRRDRAAEFTADRTQTGEDLLAGLSTVVARCQKVLLSLEGQPLDRVVAIQTYQADVLGIVFHAVEHMSYHTGQILFIAKQVRGADHGLEFYPQHRGE